MPRHLGIGKCAVVHPGGCEILVADHYPVVIDEDSPDLYRTVTVIRREAGGFKVENDYAVIAHGCTLTLNRIIVTASRIKQTERESKVFTCEGAGYGRVAGDCNA